MLNAADASLSLAGPWRFQLDLADAGIRERWFDRALPDKIKLPGSLSAQGVGDPASVDTKWIGGIANKSWFTEPEYAKYRQPGNVKMPFWLTPESYYAGAAWYQRDIVIPPDWRDQRVTLSLERPHWETRVWVDDKLVGTNNALATPHDYDIGQLAPGKHTLTLRVDNRLIVDIGENSHSISDHTQGNWNGVVGKIELRATPMVWIENLQVYPNVAKKCFRVVVTSTNATGKLFQGKLSLFTEANGQPVRLPVSRNFKTATKDLNTEDEIVLGPDAPLWDEFSPNLHSLRVELSGDLDGKPVKSVRTVSFGLREISTQGTQFTINGRKAFLRGTLDCCIYPLTGYPPTDVASWKRIIKICQAHGLNLIRFHSWCPPEAAFVAADELGFYFQVEASSWANQSTTLGDGKPADDWIYAETDRILKYYGNHPSFILMPYGNEPGGKKHPEYLARWVMHYKAQDRRRLWTSGAGWPEIAENQFHVTPDPRIQGWGQGLKSRINAKPPETTTDYRDYIGQRAVPVISHEIGQWCVYPNFAEIRKYTGHLKPRNFEIFWDSLAAHQLGDLAHQFLLASGKLQTLCYKEDIESALRTPGMGGFQLLDLHDFPGQGTALVGVLDPFWESKGYVTPEEYRRFCNVTVPLARMSKRVFTTDENFEADLEVAHFEAAPLEDARTAWKLVNVDGKVVAQGELPAKTVPVDNAVPLGHVRIELKHLPAPAKYKLVVAVDRGVQPSTSDRRRGKNAALRSKFENDWDVWIYPSRVDTTVPADILVVEELNEVALARLHAGGKVLLTIAPDRVAPDRKLGRVELGFSSIFWNTAWTSRQAPHTLGVLVDPKHPLFAGFPTEFHSNWQWWYLVSQAGAMILDDLPAALRPTVQVIDDWVTNRKLGLVFEAKVGAGRLVVCSIDLGHGLDGDPVRRQFRHSLLHYMEGRKFNPAHGVTADQIRALMAEPSLLRKLGIAGVTSDSEESRHEAVNAMDGDPTTLWHTPWRYDPTGYPHHLQLEFNGPTRLRGFTALPRQDGKPGGWIRDYAFYASDNGKDWGEPVTRATFAATKDLKTVLFEKPVSGRYFQLKALSSHTGEFASLAEFSVLEAGTSSSKAASHPGAPALASSIMSTTHESETVTLNWKQLPPIPDHEGFAGAFAGVADGNLIVAGGANFPDKKPWEGGKKVWYDSVYALEKPNGTWKVVGNLPWPLGYGISVSTKAGVVCIGGSDATQHHAEVFLVSLSRGRLKIKNLPSLPVPLANGAGALVGETVYVFGGSKQPGEQAALNRLFGLDLKVSRPQWRELEACPGKPRILPVAAALDGAFYIAGGAALEQTNGKAARVYLRDAWRYKPDAGWKQLANLPKPSVAAPTPAPVAGSELFILGGDDGSLVGFEPVEKHPGFPKASLAYDVRTDSWRNNGEVPAPRATLPTTFWNGRFVLPSGEARPGVRSPEIWEFQPTARP